MEIRPANEDDAAGIAVVHVRSWQAVYRNLIPQDYLDGLDVAQRCSTWSQWLENLEWPEKGVLVAEEDRVVVGFAGFSPSRDDDAPASTGELASLYLLEERWGLGIGRALLSAVVDSWRGAGFLAATLWVLDSNDRARRFYERADWYADGATTYDDSRGFSLHEVRYRYQIV